ncbi:MAG: helix-turn-helix domain-containing protein [Kordiimonadaceae bacterium]|nr:helix-turn-helix domain-containing protein [Kordiimonadaceae bacterium]MBO6569201.1 helix-turn-helix domain-containing protein [Kordiimonadaceae bacterium]MBO6964677.1 helix-turn-helix domain-containing protein [Kordiimonadaceae bacterium]
MLDISEVAKRSGQPSSTLRYYEKRGLIQSVGRRGLKRTFEPQVVDRLALIALGRAAGFSLTEISALFTRSDGLNVDREALLAKADELDKSIKRLTQIRDDLRSSAACDAPSHLECPNFRRVMKAAGKGLIPPLKGESPSRLSTSD